MRSEEPVAPHVPPLHPEPTPSAFDEGSLGNLDDLQGVASNIMKSHMDSGESQLSCPGIIPGHRRAIVRALGPQAEGPESTLAKADRPPQKQSIFAGVLDYVAMPYMPVPLDHMSVTVANRDAA